jgi:hypothetical protein
MQGQQNAPNSTGVFLLRYCHLHVSAGNQTIVLVKFLLKKYSVIKSVKLLHNIEIHMIIG